MIVGIDLGTTFSVVSHINDQGIPRLFPDFNDPNLFRTASVVNLSETGCLVGEALESLLEDEPSLPVARFVKLQMGTDDSVYFDHNNEAWKAEDISAMILRKLVRDAEAFESDPVSAAVITVPAQFGDAERRATKDAAALAGIPEAEVADEPVAAAYYYGITEKDKDKTIMVYDLGGGTFDATILQAAPNGLFVLATEGERVGGRDFDDQIINVVAETFQSRHGRDPREDPVAAVKLRRFAENNKIKLSQPGRGQVRSSMLLSGMPLEFVMMRSQFETLIDPHLRTTMEICERCLETASLDWDDLDVVLLTGGSSRLPIVRNMMMQTSGVGAEKIQIEKPDMAISYGAAVMAENLFNNEEAKTAVTFQQVSSHDLGIRVTDPDTGKPDLKILIRKNSPLPAHAKVDCYTWRDEQKFLDFEFVQVRGGGVSHLNLGSFSFGPISSPRRGYPVSLHVTYNSEGMVEMTAMDLETGEEMESSFEDRERKNWLKLDERRKKILAIPVNE